MAHIALPPELPPGTLGLAQYRPETGRPLTELVEALLHAPGDLGRADRALIAAYVSVLNDSRFCASTTTEVCAQLLPEGRPLVDKILADPASAPISSKLRALLAIAKAVRDSGHAVTGEVVGAARRAGATDVEIHDAVLIAAVFSMLNRYNDGLAAEQRRDAPPCRPTAGGPPSSRRAPEEPAEAGRLADEAENLAEAGEDLSHVDIENGRAWTTELRSTAVARAIGRMNERLDESHELHDIAQTVFMSPFHFHRIFRTTCGTSPGRFLTALRMARAKRLLIETSITSTEVGLKVGYSSFGTFTTTFTKLVGLPPGKFRACVRPIADVPIHILLGDLISGDGHRADGGIRGWLEARPDGTNGVALVGLFPSGIPQEPVACAGLAPPGPVHLPKVSATGAVTALAVSVRADASVREVLTESPRAAFYVGAAEDPIDLDQASGERPFRIALRERRLTDPPILLAFPLLLNAART